MLRESEPPWVRLTASSHYNPDNAVAYSLRLAENRVSIESGRWRHTEVSCGSRRFDGSPDMVEVVAFVFLAQNSSPTPTLIVHRTNLAASLVFLLQASIASRF